MPNSKLMQLKAVISVHHHYKLRGNHKVAVIGSNESFVKYLFEIENMYLLILTLIYVCVVLTRKVFLP